MWRIYTLQVVTSLKSVKKDMIEDKSDCDTNQNASQEIADIMHSKIDSCPTT